MRKDSRLHLDEKVATLINTIEPVTSHIVRLRAARQSSELIRSVVSYLLWKFEARQRAHTHVVLLCK